MSIDENKSIFNQKNTAFIVSIFIIIFLFWAISYIVIAYIFEDMTDRGNVGNIFGAINALFSGFAFAGIIYTIILQKKELELQRLELVETRKVLQRSAAAQEKSENALSEQLLSMKTTAKLNGLNTLVNFYNDQLNTNKLNSPTSRKYFNSQKNYIDEIEKIINELSG